MYISRYSIAEDSQVHIHTSLSAKSSTKQDSLDMIIGTQVGYDLKVHLQSSMYGSFHHII